ncbi:MAG: SUMF1/EgtB/PvdO family nonheme iron enzyme, partial [Pontiella sp.]|nr:SUMF1/EgtB/PvdO family nonheme iron enzyme [Pontiella sp.]
MELTPKSLKKKSTRCREKVPLVLKNWRNPFQMTILVIALVSFLGTTGVDRLKERRIYKVQVNRAGELRVELDALNHQALQTSDELQVQFGDVILKQKSEQERTLVKRLDELNRKLELTFAEFNDCYAAMTYRYRSKQGVQEWFSAVTRQYIESALEGKNHERARLAYNASHLKYLLEDVRPLVIGEGRLEILGGNDVYKIVVWPLLSDGPRLVQADPVGSSYELPYAIPAIEKGSYLIWVTRADGGFAPYPIYMEPGETNRVSLVVPPRIPEGMVFVPGGLFYCGGEASSRYRLHQRDVPGFFIKRYEVTVGEYLEFWLELDDPQLRQACMSRIRYDEGAGEAHDAWGADGTLLDPRLSPELPVVGITAEAAGMFCAWKSRQAGESIRLPTDYEWEKAARGVDGRAYPWGSDFEPEANLALTMDNPKGKERYPLWAPPGRFLRDISVYNVNDMGGNVREYAVTADGVVQLRGGSASTPASFMRCSHLS